MSIRLDEDSILVTENTLELLRQQLEEALNLAPSDFYFLSCVIPLIRFKIALLTPDAPGSKDVIRKFEREYPGATKFHRNKMGVDSEHQKVQPPPLSETPNDDDGLGLLADIASTIVFRYDDDEVAENSESADEKLVVKEIVCVEHSEKCECNIKIATSELLVGGVECSFPVLPVENSFHTRPPPSLTLSLMENVDHHAKRQRFHDHRNSHSLAALRSKYFNLLATQLTREKSKISQELRVWIEVYSILQRTEQYDGCRLCMLNIMLRKIIAIPRIYAGRIGHPTPESDCCSWEKPRFYPIATSMCIDPG